MLGELAEAGAAGETQIQMPTTALRDFGVQVARRPRGDGDRFSQPRVWAPVGPAGLRVDLEGYDRLEEASGVLTRSEAVHAVQEVAGPIDLGIPAYVTSDEAARRQRQKRETYMARIEFLQAEALDEGYALNPASRIDFERFALGVPDVRRGNLVLLENGNLRAIWKDGQGTRLGLQFLGGGMAQYVIFKRREKERPISRVAGRDSLEWLERQFAAFELHSLLYE